MQLKDYPQPQQNNARGLHWSSSPTIWGQDNWDFWKKELLDMHISWVKVLDSPGGSAQGLVERLLDIGIMPIVRFFIHEQNPYPMAVAAPATIDTIARYVKLGVRYFETNNEPDSNREWQNKRPENWLEIVTQNYLIDWSQITDVGGIAGFPSFSFGGGRQNPFELIADWGMKHVFNRMWIPIHNYGLNRPAIYPNDVINMEGVELTKLQYEWDGGLWAFERSREAVNRDRLERKNPKASIEKDFTCFRAFERFNTWFESVAGFSVPIITTEGGWNVSAFVDDRYPKLTPKHASEVNLFSERQSWPDYYFSNMYWLVACNRIGVIASDYESQALYGHWWDSKFNTKGELPLVQMWKDNPGTIRASGPTPKELPLYGHSWPKNRNWNDAIKFTTPRHHVEFADHKGGEYWKLQTIEWEPEGIGRVYVRVMINDEFKENIIIQSERGDGLFDTSRTKGITDNYYGNLPVYGTVSVYIPNMIPSDILYGVSEGTVHATFVLATGDKLMFDHKKYIQDFIDSPTVVFPDSKYNIQLNSQVHQSEIYWKVIGIHHLLPDENNGNHNLYLDVIDENGKRIIGSQVQWTWEGRREDETVRPAIIDKPDNEPGGNIGVGGNMVVSAWMGDASDIISNVSTLLPDELPGNTVGHHSFYVVWQKVILEDNDPPSDSEPIPDPLPDDTNYKELVYQIYDLIKDLV